MIRWDVGEKFDDFNAGGRLSDLVTQFFIHFTWFIIMDTIIKALKHRFERDSSFHSSHPIFTKPLFCDERCLSGMWIWSLFQLPLDIQLLEGGNSQEWHFLYSSRNLERPSICSFLWELLLTILRLSGPLLVLQP